MEPQLEVDLMEGNCALDAENVALTLMRFDELDAKSNSINLGFRLSETVQVKEVFVIWCVQHLENFHST